jgi:hypothetical protein
MGRMLIGSTNLNITLLIGTRVKWGSTLLIRRMKMGTIFRWSGRYPG